MVRGKVIVILLLASLLISPLGTSPVSAADGEETQGVLPDAVVAELLQNCDPEAIAQVYQEYTQKLTAEVSPAPVKVVPRPTVIEKAPLAAEVVTQAGIEQLKREIAAIVEQCFTRELGNLRCPDAPCAAAAYLQQAARLKSGYLDNPALPAPREELGMQLPLVVKKCLHKLLEDCNCDVACLECLLQAVGSDAAYADLVAQIRDKLERCRETEPTRQPVAPSLPPALKEEEQAGPPPRQPVAPSLPPAEEEEQREVGPIYKEQEVGGVLAGPLGEPLRVKVRPPKPEAVEEACRRLEQLLGEAREKAVQKAEQEGKAERIAGIETDFDRLEKLLGEALQRATAEEVAPVETEIVELKLSGTSPLGPVELTLPVDRVNVSVFERLTETTDTQVRLIWEEVEVAELAIVGGKVTFSHQGSSTEVKLPLMVQQGRLYCPVGDELHAINLLPGDIVAALETEPASMSLELGVAQLPVYDVSWEEPGRLFGLVPLTLLRQMTIDAASGEVLSLDQPWWGYLVTGIADIVPGVLFQQAQQAQPPRCLCEYIKVQAFKRKVKAFKRNKWVYLSKVERKKMADVKIVEKKDNETHTTILGNVNVEYYEIIVRFKLTVKLKCCEKPKNKECTANVTVTAEPPIVLDKGGDAGEVKLLGEYWVPRVVVKSAHFVDKKEIKTQLKKQLKYKCGWGPESKTFQVNCVIRLERRLTPQEFGNEQRQKDKDKINNFADKTDIIVILPIHVSCDGWDKELKIYDHRGNELGIGAKDLFVGLETLEGWKKLDNFSTVTEEVTIKEKPCPDK